MESSEITYLEILKGLGLHQHIPAFERKYTTYRQNLGRGSGRYFQKNVQARLPNSMFEEHPRLFDMPDMIRQEFNVCHPKLQHNLFQTWPSISKLLVQYGQEEAIDVVGLDSAYSSLAVDKLNTEQAFLLGFLSLPYLLSKCPRRETGESHSEVLKGSRKRSQTTKGLEYEKHKKARTVKASVQECFKKLVIFKPEQHNVKHVITNNESNSPYILGLGSMAELDVKQYFVILYKVAIPCENSILSAIDTCFKCYQVFYLDFPLECKQIWLFFKYGIFGWSDPANEVAPIVKFLVGQIVRKVLV